MRTIEQADGTVWDVAVGKESYSGLVLLFTPRRGAGVWRRAMSEWSTQPEAEDALRAMEEANLHGFLEEAVEAGPG
ncbi:hypothetical protein SAMN05660831_01753 [Thiohalospira halophila DSM 15071]|uniref:Uncharacterized protein n=1 Tax=Thiohalospira halophila DSM 15071 TaxID=1123397 RepID=A0A1I1SP69_9GAMM|nr:hypothetical protein [Thiohalospira halophila]SFD48254.1 hypothetical protein SAMN05660831_01753 [Thiohalospira halophila DSM 15071]